MSLMESVFHNNSGIESIIKDVISKHFEQVIISYQSELKHFNRVYFHLHLDWFFARRISCEVINGIYFRVQLFIERRYFFTMSIAELISNNISTYSVMCINYVDTDVFQTVQAYLSFNSLLSLDEDDHDIRIPLSFRLNIFYIHNISNFIWSARFDIFLHIFVVV